MKSISKDFSDFISLLCRLTFNLSSFVSNNQQDILQVLGSMFISVIFLGIVNCSSVAPSLATERTVMYRERYSEMYSSLAFALAQVMHSRTRFVLFIKKSSVRQHMSNRLITVCLQVMWCHDTLWLNGCVFPFSLKNFYM